MQPSGVKVILQLGEGKDAGGAFDEYRKSMRQVLNELPVNNL